MRDEASSPKVETRCAVIQYGLGSRCWDICSRRGGVWRGRAAASLLWICMRNFFGVMAFSLWCCPRGLVKEGLVSVDLWASLSACRHRIGADVWGLFFSSFLGGGGYVGS